jgi:hypothetical protein
LSTSTLPASPLAPIPSRRALGNSQGTLAALTAHRRVSSKAEPTQVIGSRQVHWAEKSRAQSQRNCHFALDKRTSRCSIRLSVVDNAQLMHKGTGRFRLGIYEPDGWRSTRMRRVINNFRTIGLQDSSVERMAAVGIRLQIRAPAARRHRSPLRSVS